MRQFLHFENMNPTLPYAWKWSKRIGLSLLDQGLFSGTNFLLTILLARWLSPEEYGAFAIAFATFIFCSGFHNALILEPMSIFGPLKPISAHKNYLISLFGLQLLLSCILGAGVIILGVFFHNPLKQALIGIGFNIPFILSVWFFRNSFYVRTDPQKALLISSVYSFGLICLLIGYSHFNQITLNNIFFIIGIACIPTISVGLLIYQKYQAVSNPENNYVYIIKENWAYGKWIVLTAITNGITTLSFAPMVGFILGLKEAAAFKGWQNIVNPMQQVLTAGALLLVPKLTTKNLQSAGKSLIKKILGASLLLTSIYITFYTLFSNKIISFLYQRPFYLTYAWLGYAFSVYLIIMAINTTLIIFLRASKQSKGIFIGKLYSSIALIVIIPFLLLLKSFQWIMVVYISIILIETVVLYIFIKRNNPNIR